MQAHELFLDVIGRPIPRTPSLPKHGRRDRRRNWEDPSRQPPQRNPPQAHGFGKAAPKAIEPEDGIKLSLHAADSGQDEGAEKAVEGTKKPSHGKMLAVVGFSGQTPRTQLTNADAGKRLTVADEAGKPLRSRDSRGQTMRADFDDLPRPLRAYVKTRTGEKVATRTIYGESLDATPPRWRSYAPAPRPAVAWVRELAAGCVESTSRSCRQTGPYLLLT